MFVFVLLLFGLFVCLFWLGWVFTFARFLLQRRPNKFKRIEVVDNEDVLVVWVGGDVLQLRLQGIAHADGEDSDAFVSETLSFVSRSGMVMGTAVGDHNGDLGCVGSGDGK